jgi:UDP:flavonoid glycosyltransferase YjiC (YdhE family)
MCFLPDAGHVLPLLRIGRLFAEAGWEISCYVAEDFESAVRDFGFEYRPIHLGSRHRLAQIARILSEKSVFYNAFSNYMDLYDFYWIPLRAAVSQELSGIADALEATQPQALLCDSHEFLDWYERLAQCCGARLIVNRADGTLRRVQRPFVRTYGYGSRAATFQWLIEVSGRLSEQGLRLWRAIAHQARRGTAISEMTSARKQAQIAFRSRAATQIRKVQIVSGLAVLERLLGYAAEASKSSREITLAPAIGNEPTRLSSELETWITAQEPKSIIYVSFGTMVVLSESMIVELILGLAAVGASVIWSLPTSQRGALEKHDIPESLRIEQFVPQRALLSSGRIRCFITHGGSNSCQEAAASGVPVLCVPFMWDQPYNGSLLVRLGMARMLPKHRVTRTRVSSEVRELLNNPQYAESARQWASALEELYGSAPQQEFRRELVE